MPATVKQHKRIDELNGKLQGTRKVTGRSTTHTITTGDGLVAELAEQLSYLNAAQTAITRNALPGAIGQNIRRLPPQEADEDASTYATVVAAVEANAATEMRQVFSVQGYTSTVMQENFRLKDIYEAEVDKLTAEVKKIEDELAKIQGDILRAEKKARIDASRKRGAAQEATAAGDERKIQDQCFLLANLGKVLGEAPDTYSNFAVVTGDTNLVVNALSSKKDGQALLDAKPESFSALQPLIKFSKVLLDTNGKPTSTVDFPFGTKSFDPKEMLKPHNREAGVEAFTYAFQGQDFVTADTHLKCTAKFYFKTMSGFIDEQTIAIGRKKVKLAFSDLASYTKTGPSGNYLIKAEIGWATPPPSNSVVNQDQGFALRDAIKNTRISLWLEPQSFSYSFNDDGSVAVDVSYTGAIYSMLRDNNFDIFKPSTSSTNFNNAQILRLSALLHLLDHVKSIIVKGQTIGDINEDVLYQAAEDAASQHSLGGSTASVEAVLKDLLLFGTKKVPTTRNIVWEYVKWTGWWSDNTSGATDEPVVLDEIRQQVSTMISLRRTNSKYNRWKTLLTAVLNGGGLWKAVVGARAYTAYQDDYRNGSLAVESRDRFAQTRKAYPGSLTINPSLSPRDKKKIHSKVAKKYKAVLGGGDAPMPIVGSGPITSAGNYEITFMYFGALVNAALETMELARSTSGENIYNNIDFLLGPIDLPTASGGTKTVSLADVPISLDLFLQFFVNDIIEGDRSEYNVVDFITNVLNKLLIPALGEMCFDISNKRMAIKQTLIRTADKKVSRTSGHMTDPRIKRNTRVSSAEVQSKFATAPSTTKDPNLLRYYFLIYSADQDVSSALQKRSSEKFAAFRKRLKLKGVYTLQTGRGVGLVDNVVFSMAKQQYVQEARITSAAHKGLYIDHNADISLIGNTLFTNGMMVYLDPNFIGAGVGAASRQKLQKFLRIGGFYVITRVEGTIGITGFQTKLHCIYQNT